MRTAPRPSLEFSSAIRASLRLDRATRLDYSRQVHSVNGGTSTWLYELTPPSAGVGRRMHHGASDPLHQAVLSLPFRVRNFLQVDGRDDLLAEFFDRAERCQSDEELVRVAREYVADA